jgi:homocitrate synthase NifV
VVEQGRIGSVGAIDASRCSLGWLEELAGFCVELGAARFRLADTVGVWEPFAVFDIVKRLCEVSPKLPIGLHAHNDLGLATANCLAAVRAGASVLDVTVGGLGERAGNAALEQVAMALAVTGYGTTSLKLSQLPHLCELVAGLAALPIHPASPIVGANAFRHSSGIHVNGMLKNTESFEGFPPVLCGRRSELTIDAHSGRAALRATLESHGMSQSDDSVLRELTNDFKRRGAEGRSLDVSTLLDLIDSKAYSKMTK